MADVIEGGLGEVVALDARRIGLIADSHCDREDGSDLPAEAIEALRGVDLVIDLGHTGSPDRLCRGVLDRLEAEVAPVLSVQDFYGGADAPVLSPAEGRRVDGLARVIDVGGVRIGAIHNLERGPGPQIAAPPGGLPELDGTAVGSAVSEKFGGQVDVVAFGGTHRPATLLADGILFVNPGSPTYPKGPGRVAGQLALGTVGILSVDDDAKSFEVIDLHVLNTSATATT
jgi:predicted phosphodiesterase